MSSYSMMHSLAFLAFIIHSIVVQASHPARAERLSGFTWHNGECLPIFDTTSQAPAYLRHELYLYESSPTTECEVPQHNPLWWAVQQDPGSQCALSVARCAVVLGASVNGPIDQLELFLDGQGYNTPLLQAVKRNNIAMTELLLEASADLIGENGNESPLVAAVDNGNIEMLKLLLSASSTSEELGTLEARYSHDIRRARVNSCDHNGVVLLSLAILKRDDSIIDLLLQEGADVNGAVCSSGPKPLRTAVNYGKLSTVETLLKAGATLGDPEDDKAMIDAKGLSYSAMCVEPEISCQRLAIVHFMLTRTGPTRKKSIETPITRLEIPEDQIYELLHTWQFVKLDAFKVLVEAGINVNAPCPSTGNSLLDDYASLAIVKTFPSGDSSTLQDYVSLLLDHGADINSIEPKGGLTPLMRVTAIGYNLDLLKFLLARGADIHRRDFAGKSLVTHLFMSLIGNEHVTSMLEAILDHDRAANDGNVSDDMKAQLDLRGAKSRVEEKSTPLMYTLRPSKRNFKSAKLLIAAGCDVSSTDRVGNTPMHLAVGYRGMPKLVPFLVEKGADIEARDADGRTPLFKAVLTDNLKGIARMIKHGAHIDAMDDKGVTPLLWAARRGQFAAAKLLLMNEASVEKAFEGDKGLLEYCKRDGHHTPHLYRKITEILLEYGARKWHVEGVVSRFSG